MNRVFEDDGAFSLDRGENNGKQMVCLSLEWNGDDFLIKKEDEPMALVNCPECNKEISDTSEKCIHCGYTLHPELKGKKKKKRLITILSIAAILFIAVACWLAITQGKNASAFENSKEAYQTLNEVSELCRQAISDIYGAWYWGIYEYDDYESHSTNASALQREVMVDLNAGSEAENRAENYLGLAKWLYDSEWEACVDLVTVAYEESGIYATADALMSEAQAKLKIVSEKNADYQYYPVLKQYFAKLSAMLEFVKSPTGSFEQLKTTKNDYINAILTYQGDLSFVFAE